MWAPVFGGGVGPTYAADETVHLNNLQHTEIHFIKSLTSTLPRPSLPDFYVIFTD